MQSVYAKHIQNFFVKVVLSPDSFGFQNSWSVCHSLLLSFAPAQLPLLASTSLARELTRLSVPVMSMVSDSFIYPKQLKRVEKGNVACSTYFIPSQAIDRNSLMKPPYMFASVPSILIGDFCPLLFMSDSISFMSGTTNVWEEVTHGLNLRLGSGKHSFFHLVDYIVVC